jgi:hypothetical protein
MDDVRAVIDARAHSVHPPRTPTGSQCLSVRWQDGSHEHAGRPSLTTDRAQMERIAALVQAALPAADLTDYRELLDPKVTWGAEDDFASGCQNRDQVLAWYRQGRAKGVRADVTETIVQGDKILVGLRVIGNEAAEESGSPVLRWQVLTVRNGLIIDIRGFEERTGALSLMG